MQYDVRALLLHGAVRQTRDLDLDRVARQEDVGLADAEGVHAVADVLERLVHGVAIGVPSGADRITDDAALQVEAEHRLAAARSASAATDTDHEHATKIDRDPQSAASLHASSCPLIDQSEARIDRLGGVAAHLHAARGRSRSTP